MSFVNDLTYTLRRSNKEIFYFFCDDGLKYKCYDSNNNLVKKNSIFEKNLKNFTLFNFCLDKNDDIYGILSLDNLKIVKCPSGSNDFIVDEVFKFDFQKFAIAYPSINKIDNEVHIFYYVYDLGESNTSVLFHLYKENKFIKEQKIDFITHTMLDEYKVIYRDNSPSILYFNIVDGFEEIFISNFDQISKKWSKPFRITNSKNNKIHLDAVFYNDYLHISYCYKENDSYCVNYLKIASDNTIEKTQTLAKDAVFMYPSFLTEDDRIYLMWVELNKLYTSYSIDNGDTWYKEILDTNSLEVDFIRSKFLSNYIEDIDYNNKNLFTTINEISFLGF